MVMENQIDALFKFLKGMESRLDQHHDSLMKALEENTLALQDLCGKPPATSAAPPAPPPTSTVANSDEREHQVATKTTTTSTTSPIPTDGDLCILFDADDEAIDRLSRLPDSLLRDIIGCLPVKDAARTAVLSRRWNPIFSTSAVPHLGDVGLRFHGIEGPVPSELFDRPLDAVFVVTTNGSAEQAPAPALKSYDPGAGFVGGVYFSCHGNPVVRHAADPLLSNNSGERGNEVWCAPSHIVEEFQMEQSVPPHLFAFAAGDLDTRGRHPPHQASPTSSATPAPSQDAVLGFQMGVTELHTTSPARCSTLALCEVASGCSVQGHGSDEVTTLSLCAFFMTAVAKGTLHHEENTSKLLNSSWPPPTQDECKSDGIDTWSVHWQLLECSNGAGLLVPQPWPPPCVVICWRMIFRIIDQHGWNYWLLYVESNIKTEESTYLMRNWKPPWVFARVFRTWVLLVSPLSLLRPPDT